MDHALLKQIGSKQPFSASIEERTVGNDRNDFAVGLCQEMPQVQHNARLRLFRKPLMRIMFHILGGIAPSVFKDAQTDRKTLELAMLGQGGH
ncbi:hypothetical protein D3C77_187980 [compost metagenome]